MLSETSLGNHENAASATRRSGLRYGLTSTGWRFVVVITGLSIAHHIDHVIRGMTGWPIEGPFNPFSASLFVYPVIALGVLLSARQRVGPGFWSLLAGGGAVFLLVVHVGPAAGDAITDIPEQYDSVPGGAIAIVILFALVIALFAHCSYEVRRLFRARR